MSDENDKPTTKEGDDPKAGSSSASASSPRVSNPDRELTEAELAELDDKPALSALLKRSLAKEDDVEPAPDKDAELLASVQRKLRKRSKGKFYGDGWSTTQSRVNYALIAMVMLVTIVAVYLALGPTGFSLR